jgi:hypothetical protein
VWDHAPTADELLDRRIEHGWHPAPSDLRDGSRILGHAACRFALDDGSAIVERKV